ncbi:MAG: ankyrin repeat domain-containing protein [Victivallaceae bacterium]|nr:ankyrin repeat domain-containing protein [Victivallaceae bacterium]
MKKKQNIIVLCSIICVFLLWFCYSKYKQRIFREQLLDAIEQGNISTIEKLLLTPKKINFRYTSSFNDDKYTGDTPLSLAVYKNSLMIVKLLLNKGANPNFYTEFNDGESIARMSILYHAVRTDKPNLDIIENLLNHGVSKNDHMSLYTTIQGDATESSLMYCCYYTGNIELIDLLLKYGMNVNYKDTDGYTALSSAALSPKFKSRAEKLEVIRKLLSHGATVDLNIFLKGSSKPPFQTLGERLKNTDIEVYELLKNHSEVML